MERSTKTDTSDAASQTNSHEPYSVVSLNLVVQVQPFKDPTNNSIGALAQMGLTLTFIGAINVKLYEDAESYYGAGAGQTLMGFSSSEEIVGLLLGAMMVVSPIGGVPSMGLDRSRGGGGGGGADDEDRAPLAYAAPRATGQRVPYDYEAF